MASTATDGSAPSDLAPGTISIKIKVMNPGEAEPQIISRTASLSSTILDLKEQIKSETSAQSDPDTQRLRLIYQGKQLSDDAVLEQAFQNTSVHILPSLCT